MKKTLIATIAMLMLASLALANGGGRGGSAASLGDLADGNLLVASDGTVFVTRTVIDTSTRSATTTVTAIRPTGTTAWTATLPERDAHLVLSGNNLLSLTFTAASDRSVSSTITALSTASGAVAWTRTLSGRVTELEPFSGGTYAIVVVPAATAGGTATRQLVAIGNDGSVLWTVTV